MWIFVAFVLNRNGSDGLALSIDVIQSGFANCFEKRVAPEITKRIDAGDVGPGRERGIFPPPVSRLLQQVQSLIISSLSRTKLRGLH